MDGKRLNWLILVFILVFLLRLPSLFEPFTYGDEGIYLTLGQALRKGLVWYRDIHDNKPPLLYLLAALAGNFSYFRLILFIWSLATIYVFFKLCQFLFPKNKLAQIISPFLFAILISVHTFEGNVANAENFMMLPTLVGFYLVLKNFSWFWAGVMLSLATLFKVPAGFDFTALLVFGFLTSKSRLGKFFQKAEQATLGFFLPIVLTLVYYANRGALLEYLKAAFFQNIPYLASWVGTQAQTWGSLPWPLLIRGILLLGVVTILFLFRRRLGLSVILVISWFTFSLFAALLSSRPYPHYLLQVIPSLALSFGLVFAKTKEKIIPIVLSFCLAFSFLYFKFWHYPNISYYQNFYQFAFGLKDRQDYFNYFGNHAQVLYRTAEYLKLHTSPEEKIFIWGNQPSIYALANRLPVSRYTVAYHIIDFNGYQETISALTKDLPPYILISGEEQRSFPTLFAILENNYTLAGKINDFQIFRLPLKPK